MSEVWRPLLLIEIRQGNRVRSKIKLSRVKEVVAASIVMVALSL